MEGSFCRCRKGSPAGQFVPETMLMFCPAIWANVAIHEQTTTSHANARRTTILCSPRTWPEKLHNPALKFFVNSRVGEELLPQNSSPKGSNSHFVREQHQRPPRSTHAKQSSRSSLPLSVGSRWDEAHQSSDALSWLSTE